jgi:hypothetical protein
MMTEETWGAYYWPGFLIAQFVLLFAPEGYALATNWRNTLSNWVWDHLNITKNESISQWSATDFLLFGAWMVVVTWLTFHFFLRKFT